MDLRTTVEEACFLQNIVDLNGLTDHGFVDWVFRPGMLFNSWAKWWGEPGVRATQHEGLDIRLYLTREGSLGSLDETSLVPAICTGFIAAIIDDFLGQTVIVRHDDHGPGDVTLLSLLAHITPNENLGLGARVTAGDVIGKIASTRRRKSGIGPHLHVSFASVQDALDIEHLSWSDITARRVLTLKDPLDIIDPRE